MVGSCRGIHRLFNRLLTRVRHVGSANSFRNTHTLMRGCTIGMSPILRTRMLRHCGGLGLTPCGNFIGPGCRLIASSGKGVASIAISCDRNCMRRVLHCDGSCSPLPSMGGWSRCKCWEAVGECRGATPSLCRQNYIPGCT